MASPRSLTGGVLSVLLGLVAILTGVQRTTAFGAPPPPPRFPPPGGNAYGPNEGRGDGADDDGDSFGNIKSSVLMCAVVARPTSACAQGQDDTCLQTLTSDVDAADTTTTCHGASAGGESSSLRLLQVRGGGITDAISQKRDDLVTGLKDAVDDTLSYWGGALDYLDTRFLPGGRTRQREKAEARSAKASATAASRQAKGRGPKSNTSRKKGRLTKEEKEAERLADAVIVKSVSAPNSTVLPPSALADAGRQSGLVGGKFVPDTVQSCAARVDQWYRRAGYLANSVTGATLDADAGVAKLEVEEATVSSHPVDIVCVKEVAIDDRTGETMSLSAMRRKLILDGGSDSDGSVSFNTTITETKGRTKAAAIAAALNLRPGEPFKFDPSRWNNRIESASGGGIFSRVWNLAPVRAPDGSVVLRVVATEAPARNLEYGVTKSLYNDIWEGEAGFSHNNLFGAGERLDLMIRRGTREPHPSFNAKFTGNALTPESAYDLEAFSEYIGVTGHEGGASSRRGLTVRFPRLLSRRIRGSSSIEKTAARTAAGEHDHLIHSSFDIGPYYQKLPSNGRSSVQATANIGGKLDLSKMDLSKMKKGITDILGGMTPYSSYAATMRQIIPLRSSSAAANKPPITLALQHRATASTSELPQHEALAIGFSARVRGYSPKMNGPLSSSVVGTAEIRIPVTLPANSLVNDGSVVVFSDWMAASRWTIRDIKNKVKSKTVGSSASAPLLSKPMRKASAGIGLRSFLQGIPVKVDFSITDDGKIGANMAIGQDFDVDG
eukprot:CAMPEP_0181071946 /NCGR_PEP_ID=MMETSP1070-20121207/28315_1 /TAXON_ID=265543 /ORGANISM="Minutocellus polymorphus, Strain NH13" /LENGTH=779 /DNA_ID=CAMNT_0023152981 /DNA_START=37 /DNA_END=2373 /DNA_ORIENTATION=+